MNISFLPWPLIRNYLKKMLRSIWFYPALVTVALVILSALQISGSSIGVYHIMFYGNQLDPYLLTKVSSPQSIRSDEWIVNTQKAVAQKYNDFNTINSHQGMGENETLLADVPTRDWSIIFKPHDIAFLALPFDNAFSLRWWLMSYFLVLSVYFFILSIFPAKKWVAILLSISFLFSPFLQWWYTYGTLGSIYYALFGATVFIKLLHSKKLLASVLWSALLIYIATCFTLILYPPFQIPVALVLLAFVIGYVIDNRKTTLHLLLKQKILLLLCAILVTGSLVGLFLYQQKDTITAISHTAYPGQRVVQSGGYNIEHLLSSNLSNIFQDQNRARNYGRPEIGATNQSESSNFILLVPLLVLPLGFLLYRRYKQQKSLNATAISLFTVGLLFLAWAFIPHIGPLGKITLLNLVPLNRLLIGFGLLDLLLFVIFIKEYTNTNYKFSWKITTIYSLCILILYLLIDFHVMRTFPNFIGFKSAVLLAIPFTIIVFLLLRKYFVIAAAILLIFIFASTYRVNPLYQGTEVITETPLSQAIRNIGATSKAAWVSDYVPIENFAAMNGERSLTGTYTYPQLGLWDGLGLVDQRSVYNRYAHVSFTFDRDAQHTNKPQLKQATADSFNVTIEACDPFLARNHVGFLITTKPFQDDEASCAHLTDTVTYPNLSFYIYSLSF